MHTRQAASRVRMVALVVLGTVGAAHATSLTQTRDLSGSSVVLQASPDNVTPQADGKTYAWADKNGDGTSNDAVNAGLNLAGYNLTRTTDTIGFTLNLYDGASDGAIAWGGVAGGLISTKRTDGTDKSGSPITITGATDIVCANIDASGNGTGAGGPIQIAQSGNLTVTNIITTPRNASSTKTGGAVTLCGAGRTSGIPAGWLQILSSIANAGTYSASILICGYDKVTVGAGGILSYQSNGSSSGSMLNSVTITNIGAGGVMIAGPIQTYSLNDHGQGPVTIQTVGAVQLASVDTHRGLGGNWVNEDAGRVQITAGGNVEVTGGLDTSMLGNGSGYSRNAGDIGIISTNGWVKLNSIVTTNKANDSARYAGDVSVSAHGDLTIAGTINLYSPYGGNHRGDLTLTTDSHGSIFLGTLDMANANLVKFDSGTGISQITNALANFSTTYTNGEGTASNPFVTTQTQFRVPAGERVYYVYVPGGLNNYLDGRAYKVADIAGSSGAGGILRPQVRGGTAVYFR